MILVPKDVYVFVHLTTFLYFRIKIRNSKKIESEVIFMPRKPQRPCSFPGCPYLTNGRYCDVHQRAENRRYERFERDPETKSRYGRNWKLIRDKFLKAHPTCSECEKEGWISLADEVHHIVPLSKGGSNSPDNLVSLCHACHSRIHARQGDRWRKKGRS